MSQRATIALLIATLSLVGSGIGAPAAGAGTATGRLTIAPAGNDQYTLVASGNYSGYYYDGVDVAVRLWGDDEWFDDLLFTPLGTTFEGRWSGHFERQFTVSGSVLNEDWGQDEIYAEARLYDHRTRKLVQTIKTNLLFGHWS